MATSQGMIGQWYDDYVKNPPKTATYAPTQATNTQWQVDKPQTVQGQVAGIVDSGSPLMQQAQTRALQKANSRGMLNSSMAVGAAQGALYDAALPMAQQDANTFARAGEFNAGEANRTSQFNAGAQNDAGRFNAGEANTQANQRFGAAAQFGLQDKQQQFQAGESALDRTFSRDEREASQAFDMTKLNQQQANALQQMDVAQRNDLIRMQEAFGFEMQKMDAQQLNTMAQMAQQFKDNVSMVELQNKLGNENIPKQYAAQFSQQMFDRVSTILGDPNLDPEAKKAAVQNAIDFANTSMSWVGTMYGVAFPSMTSPSATSTPAPGGAPPPAAPPAAAPPPPRTSPGGGRYEHDTWYAEP